MVNTAGVDLGGTKIQAAVMRGQRVVGQSRRPTPQTGAPDVIAAMAEAVIQALSAVASKTWRG